MGCPTKVQLISRKMGADQYYVNFPTNAAEAMEFQKGEVIASLKSQPDLCRAMFAATA